MESDRLKEKIRLLLASQDQGVLATNQEGHPYTSLVTFSFSEDLRQIFFATPRASRKFANLQTDPRVSMLIDSRNNGSGEFKEIEALSLFGNARDVTGLERQKLVAVYLERHPELEEFVRSSNCALVRIKVRRYALVRRLMDVGELSFEN